jgi:hypothetical protein
MNIITEKFDPCAAKLKLRTAYRNGCIIAPSRCHEEAVARSLGFWPKYQQINDDYDPTDPVYSISRAGGAMSTTLDHLHLKAAASGQARILEIIWGGEATTSAANRAAVQQNNATLGGATALTPEKFSSRSASAAGTYGHSNNSAILSAGQYLFVWACNAFAGMIDWKAAPGEEIYFVNGEVIGLRSLSGTSTFSSTIVFEEL